MNKEENKSTANKPKREDDHIKKNDLPYDPEINRDDLQALHQKGHSMNPGQDKELAERDRPVDFTAKDLDIPGRDERDTTHNESAIPDEENYQFNQRGIRTDSQKDGDHPNPDREVPRKD